MQARRTNSLQVPGIPGGGRIPTPHSSQWFAMCNGHLCHILQPSLCVLEFWPGSYILAFMITYAWFRMSFYGWTCLLLTSASARRPEP